jgi:dienelactone hydrolase
LLGFLLAYAAAAAQNLGGWFIPQRGLDSHVEMLRPGVEVHLPETSDESVPAILLFHGCGGQRPMHRDYADAIVAAGFAVVLVDSFAPRGIGRLAAMTQVCPGLRLHGQERAADVFAALAIVREIDRVDSQRLVLAGWSHGGWALLDAASYAAEDRRPAGLRDGEVSFEGVVRIAAIYPYCSFPSRASGRLSAGLPPVTLILAERDLVAPTADCERLARRAVGAGADMAYEIWPGVTHAFDDPDAPALDPRMQYDAIAAERLRVWLIGAAAETED